MGFLTETNKVREIVWVIILLYNRLLCPHLTDTAVSTVDVIAGTLKPGFRGDIACMQMDKMGVSIPRAWEDRAWNNHH